MGGSGLMDGWRAMGVEQGGDASYMRAAEGLEGADGGCLAAGGATEGW